MGLAQIRIPEIPKKISKAHSCVQRGKVRKPCFIEVKVAYLNMEVLSTSFKSSVRRKEPTPMHSPRLAGQSG